MDDAHFTAFSGLVSRGSQGGGDVVQPEVKLVAMGGLPNILVAAALGSLNPWDRDGLSCPAFPAC